MLVVRIPGFAPISPRARDLDGSTADQAWCLFGVFSIREWRRGRRRELPLYEGEVLVDGISEGSTCSYGGCAQAWCAECGRCRG